MASGNTLYIWPVTSGVQPAANYATWDTRNDHTVADFDDTTDESLIFSGVLPRHYGGGGITAYHHYSMTSATANAVKLEGAFERVGDGQQDIDADGFASGQNTGDVTVPATSGHVDIASIAFTDGAQIDSIAVGEKFRYKVTSKVPAGTKATGDRELQMVELKET